MTLNSDDFGIFGHYPFELPPLPYAYDALEPYIDEETMHFHHDKHFATYIKNLNDALEPYPFLHNVPLERILCSAKSLPEESRVKILNNAGGVYNHTLFFRGLAPASEPVHEPEGKLLEAIEGFFGSFEHFKEEFSDEAKDVFGSGWTVLVSDSESNLDIRNTANQDVLICEGLEPIILFDVWEHAYYLKYKNERADYIKNLWNIIRFK
ncbi:MAG: superoxide dismutase [Oscillospiraceae bacterium]|nr:superoxide dismutase [Oscillospiraceae bacterium]